MKLVFFFLSASVLFTVAAIPMMLSFGSPNVPSASNAPSGPSGPVGPNHVPNVVFGQVMTLKDKTSGKDTIIDHYKGLEPDNEHKQARLAYAKFGWRNGNGPDDEHKQYLNFDYHRGEHPNSDKIGQTVTVSRDRPPPEPHFSHSVSKENKAEIAKEMVTKYQALPPDQAKRVRSMRAHGDWVDGPGLREETQFSFHRGPIPSVQNKLWDPVTIYRPLSFLMDAVPKEQIPGIKKRIREEHEKLNENHPLKQANYGVVTHGWKKVSGSADPQAGAMMYKVKDQISDEDDFERIGYHRVSLQGHGQGPEAVSSSSSST